MIDALLRHLEDGPVSTRQLSKLTGLRRNTIRRQLRASNKVVPHDFGGRRRWRLRSDLFGTWPGDETDDEIRRALEESK